jgi:hypothetical protein
VVKHIHLGQREQDVLQTSPEPTETKTTGTSRPSLFTHILKEPLLHFIIAGAAIYVLFGWFGRAEYDDATTADNTIVITQGEIDWLTESWQKRWNRRPTEDELQGIVRAHVKETVLYREALSMGLDKDDTIVRRRLAQKLEFLAQDLIQPEPLTDNQLQTYFQQHIDRYQAPDLITFTQVFLDPDQRGDQTLADAKALKAKLIASERDPSENADLGDSFMLQNYYPERSEADLAKLFGIEFARSLMELEPERWHGPVLSGYGVHLVYIHEHRVSPPPQCAEVVDQVREDLEDEKRRQLNDEFLASLLDRYKVVIEGQEDTDQAAVMETSR